MSSVQRALAAAAAAAALLFAGPSPALAQEAGSGVPCRVGTNPVTKKPRFECDVHHHLHGHSVAYFSRPFELVNEKGYRLEDAYQGVLDKEIWYYLNPLGGLASSAPIFAESGDDGEPADAVDCSKTYDDLAAGGTSTAPNKWKAAAYQYDVAAKDNTGKGCHRLTGAVDPNHPAGGFTAYLMDSEDSSKGIVLHMGGGDLCGQMGPRKLNITLACSTDKEEQSKTIVGESMWEDTTCTYEIWTWTTHGCPDGCMSPKDAYTTEKNPEGKTPGTGNPGSTHVCNADPVTSETIGRCRMRNDGKASCGCVDVEDAAGETRHVGPGCAFVCPSFEGQDEPCSGHGHCEYDRPADESLGRARCFCHSGWQGEECETASGTDSGSEGGGGGGGGGGGAALPWILATLLGLGFAGGWYYHRKEMGEPFCCCGGDGGFSAGGAGGGGGGSPPAFSSMDTGGSYVAPDI